MATGDLTTLEVVREYLQKEEIDVDQDGVIGTLVTAASDAVRVFLDRNIGLQETAATHTFELDNDRGFLPLTPHDLRSLSSIKVDTDQGSGTALTSEQYRLYPRDQELGVYTYIKLRLSGRNSWGTREIEIVGDWGIAAVDIPDVVQHWTTIAVVEWIRADVSNFSTQFDAVQERVIRPESLPSAVRAGIAHLAHRTAF